MSNVQYHDAKKWQIGLFSLNNSATNFHFNLFSLYFLVYCTEVGKLNPVLVGTIMTISRLFDAVTDPLIGLAIDRTETRFGKFRPFMLIGSVILNVSLVAMFWGVDFDSSVKTLIWLCFWYFIWVIGYTFQTAITKAGQVVLSNNPKQRPLFTGFDGVFTTITFILISSTVTPILVYFGGLDQPVGWRLVTLLVVVFNLFCTTLAILGLRAKDQKQYYSRPVDEKAPGLADYLAIIKGNKALQMLIAAASTNKLANVTMNASVVYFFMYIYQRLDLQSVVMPIVGLCGVAGAIAAAAIAVKRGNKAAFVSGTWSSILILGIILLFRPFSPDLLVLSVVMFGVMAFCGGIANNIILVMIPDSADYETWHSGRFVPGMISTTFSFVDKAISALGGLFVGIALSGYKSGMTLTPGLYWSILFVFLGIPLLGHIVSALAMVWYPIDKQFYENMTADINQRR